MLREKLRNYKIILASGSPRRQQFFRDLDLDFEVRLKEVEEIYPENLKAEQITDFLAQLKANSFEGELSENEILVTSDTIVWHHGKALGKPSGYEDAVEMLRTLSGATHEVITSVCFKTSAKADILHEVTKVTFNTLTDESITYYLDKFKPYDKAGAYGIQEWIGFVGVARIEGSYANVMGMPVDKVFEYLNSMQ
ncbi:MAG TPA: Maf-like protein [Flavobacterium sp.]|jgi:septum formation protein